MTGPMIAACVISYLAAYVHFGFAYVAPGWVAREVEKAIRRWPNLAERTGEIARWRTEYAGFSIIVAMTWPFYLAGRAVTGRIAAAAPLTQTERTEK